jgi:hypothetical protein
MNWATGHNPLFAIADCRYLARCLVFAVHLAREREKRLG